MNKKLILKYYLGFLPNNMLCLIEKDNYKIFGHVKLMYEHLPDEVLNGRVMMTDFKDDVAYIVVKEVSSAD